jgi:hypothetical protein
MVSSPMSSPPSERIIKVEQIVIQLELEVRELKVAQRLHSNEFAQLKTHLKMIFAALTASTMFGPAGQAILKLLGAI